MNYILGGSYMTLSEDLVLLDDYIVILFTSQRHPAKFIAAADLKERGGNVESCMHAG
jgi:hypothetical protein